MTSLYLLPNSLYNLMKNKIYSIILLFLLFGGTILCAQNKVDSLLQEIANAPTETAHAQLLMEVARLYSNSNPDSCLFYLGKANKMAQQNSLKRLEMRSLELTTGVYYNLPDYDKYEHLHNDLISMATELEDHFSLSKFYNKIGEFQGTIRGDLEKAHEYLLKGIEQAELAKDSMALGINCSSIGWVSKEMGNFKDALLYNYQSLDIFRAMNNPYELAYTNNNISSVYDAMGNFPKALEHCYEAIANGETVKNPDLLSRAYNSLGNLHLRLNEPDKALAALQKAAEQLEQLPPGYNHIRVTNLLNKGKAKWLQGNPQSALKNYQYSLQLAEELKNWESVCINLEGVAGIHLEQGNFEIAETQALRSLELALQHKLLMEELTGRLFLTEIFHRRGMWDKGIEQAKKVLDYAEENDILNLQADAAEWLSKLYEQKGNSTKAFTFYKKHIVAKEANFNQANTKKYTQMEMQFGFDLERAADSIAQLEKDRLVQLELDQKEQANQYLSSRNRLYLLLALALLTLLGVGTYLYQELNQAKSQLSQLNATKDRLFAIISHDLRSAISAFQNIGQIINFHLKKQNYERLGTVATQVDKSANNLNNLLDNLLQWSVSQIEGVDLKPTKLFIGKSVDEIVGLYEQNATAKGVKLQSFITEDLQVMADENSLHLVLRNLVSNAIKFTSEGDEIKINASEKDGFVEMSITDTGTGIPEEKMARIFQIDSKTSSKGTSGERGTGLGLALCKEFVERNGGRIELESVLEEGTVCRFWLRKAL